VEVFGSTKKILVNPHDSRSIADWGITGNGRWITTGAIYIPVILR